MLLYIVQLCQVILIKLGEVMKYEFIVYLEPLNIEQGRIDPEDNRC